MWHEARKHEKKIRVMIVDYRRRAERRREFYEKFKADPAQFIQIHGRPCKIYMDSQITAAADNSLMPWQGNKDITIDRFDVRAHLDFIPEVSSSQTEHNVEATPEEAEDPSLNYERYRILIQNELAGISEDKFLHQIHVEEQFGNTAPHSGKPSPFEKPKLPKAAIAYSYEDSTPAGISNSKSPAKSLSVAENAEEDSDEDLDFDLLVNVNDLTIAQKAELNNNGTKYGLGAGEFMNYLNGDAQERDDLRIAKLEAEEKLTMSGRKARRERRAFKDKIILRKGLLSPPSYAAAPEEDERRSSSRSESRSGSSSPEKVTFITSFGGNEFGADENGSKTEMGPSLPPGGLPRKNRRTWNRSKSRSRSPNVRKITSKARSRSRSPRGSSRRSRYSTSFRDKRRSSRSRSGSPRAGRSGNSGRNQRSRRRSSSSSSSRSRSDRRRRRSSSRSKYQRRRRSRSRGSSSLDRSSRKLKSNRSRDRSRERDVSRNGPNSKSRRSRSTSRRRSSRKSSSPARTKSSSPARKAVTSSRKRKSSSSSSSSDTSSPSPKPSDSLPARQSEVQTEKEEAPKYNGNTFPQRCDQVPVTKLPSPPVRRYYGRQNKGKNDSDSSDSASSSDSPDESPVKSSNAPSRNATNKSSSSTSHAASKSKPSVSTASKYSASPVAQEGSSGSSSGLKLTPQERLKRRMQLALNKQLRADKEAEKTRVERLEQERMDREDTLRELSIKYRRRERERRHNTTVTSDSSSNGSNSNNSSPDNRSRSGSPCLEF